MCRLQENLPITQKSDYFCKFTIDFFPIMVYNIYSAFHTKSVNYTKSGQNEVAQDRKEIKKQ